MITSSMSSLSRYGLMRPRRLVVRIATRTTATWSRYGRKKATIRRMVRRAAPWGPRSNSPRAAARPAGRRDLRRASAPSPPETITDAPRRRCHVASRRPAHDAGAAPRPRSGRRDGVRRRGVAEVRRGRGSAVGGPMQGEWPTVVNDVDEPAAMSVSRSSMPCLACPRRAMASAAVAFTSRLSGSRSRSGMPR